MSGATMPRVDDPSEDGIFSLPHESDVQRTARSGKRLAKLMAMTMDHRAYIKKHTYVGSLDPDLAIMRSLSLSAKIAIQRERNAKRDYEGEIEHLQKQLLGWFA